MPAHADWTAVAERWRTARPQRLWREHADAITTALCRRWWPAPRVSAALKTDLFDEAFGAGLRAFLHERADRCVGIDIAPSVARHAGAARDRLVAAAADVRQLPFASGAFNVVVSNSTLDHFVDAREITVALREIRRVLAPDGVLILTLDNRANPVVAVRNRLPYALVRRLGLVPYFVGETFTPRETIDALTSAGFRIDDVAMVMHCPRVAGVAAAAVCDRLGAGARRAFLRSAMACERMAGWPTRRWSGYFTAVRARRMP